MPQPLVLERTTSSSRCTSTATTRPSACSRRPSAAPRAPAPPLWMIEATPPPSRSRRRRKRGSRCRPRSSATRSLPCSAFLHGRGAGYGSPGNRPHAARVTPDRGNRRAHLGGARMIRRTLAVLVPLVLLVACSSSPAGSTQESQGGGQSSAPSSGGSAAESSAPSSAATQQPGGGNGLASVDLTITGGDYAGHYVVDLVGSGGCSTGVVGPGTFQVASVDVEPADAFVGPQITIYDADAAASGTDVEFSAAFPFDNYAHTVEVNPYLSRSQG